MLIVSGSYELGSNDTSATVMLYLPFLKLILFCVFAVRHYTVRLHDLGLKAHPALLVEVWSLPKKWSWCIKTSFQTLSVTFFCVAMLLAQLPSHKSGNIKGL